MILILHTNYDVNGIFWNVQSGTILLAWLVAPKGMFARRQILSREFTHRGLRRLLVGIVADCT